MLRSLPHPHDTHLHDEARLDEVVRVLDGFFDASGRRAVAHGNHFVDLWRELRDNTMGGKLFRPRMVAIAYDGLATVTDAAPGEPSPVALVGAGFELLHAALIVHDDVIDRDFVRRGRLNIAGHYRDRARAAGIEASDADHHGLSAAVVAGDLALFNAFRLVDRAVAHEGTRARLIDLMDDALFASAAGELLDVDYSGAVLVPTVENILRMSRLKTAVYSFEVPLQAGAVLAGADEAVIDSLADFGREIGTAYQIVDDLLGVFGVSEETGKSNLGDLREGKRTVLVAHAAGTDQWTETAGLFGSPTLDEHGAARLREVLESSGARTYAEQLLAEHVARARDVLTRDHIPATLSDALSGIVDAVTRRNH